MYLNVTYDIEFDELMMHLRTKYPKEIFNIDGIGDQLDMNKFSKNFFKSNTTADTSIDGNANVADSTVISYHHELPKPFFKLNSYYMLWKNLKKYYGQEVANRIIEENISGDIYINDMHGIGGRLPYCFNYSTYDIALKGLPMIQKIKSIAPKHLYSFKSQVEQFTIIAANSTLGATGLADFLIVFSWYVDKIRDNGADAGFAFYDDIFDIDKYIIETLTSFIYTVNQPSRGNQSCFINISVYDDNFLNDLVGDYLFPDGTTPKVQTVKYVQKLYLETMNKEMARTPITFPVTTACFSIENGEIKDEKFAEDIAFYNKKYGFINIFYGKTSTLSSCCFDKKQNVLVKSSSGVYLNSFEKINDMDYDMKKNFTIYHNGSWKKGKIVKIPYNNEMYEITTSNGKTIRTTFDHLHPTLNGNKPSCMLSTNDYLMFSNRSLDSFPEKDNYLTYEQGYFIGMYLGDGSKYNRKNNTGCEITLSLNESKLKDIPIIKKALNDWNDNSNVNVNYSCNNVMFVKINSRKIFNEINKYVIGNYAHEKELDSIIFTESKQFRRGICDGWYATDGGNSNRIYTTSKNIIPQAEALFNSVGLNTKVDISDRTGKNNVEIRGQLFNRNYPLYCIRWYSMKNKRSSKNNYKVVNNSEYFKIISIRKYNYNDYVYCFEMLDTTEPYFTLPNGVITHNCRLRSDKNSEYFNSFGAGSSKIGSLGVVTLNLPRLATKYSGKTFVEELKSLVVDCARINNVKRKLIQEAIDNGYHPLYTLGFIDINRQYSTVGINGFNECIEILGYDILTKDGIDIGLSIIDTINTENEKCQTQYKVPHNCEQIPGESASVKLANKDKLLGFNDKYDIYSNQFIPLTTNADMLDRIKLQGIFDKHFSGGAICHINIENEIKNEEDMVALIKTCARMNVVYWSINYTLQECENGHMVAGKVETCSICGGEIINEYTRVVGFLTNVKNWNETRRTKDYPNRIWYK